MKLLKVEYDYHDNRHCNIPEPVTSKVRPQSLQAQPFHILQCISLLFQVIDFE
jgi:hypothetical protein